MDKLKDYRARVRQQIAAGTSTKNTKLDRDLADDHLTFDEFNEARRLFEHARKGEWKVSDLGDNSAVYVSGFGPTVFAYAEVADARFCAFVHNHMEKLLEAAEIGLKTLGRRKRFKNPMSRRTPEIMQSMADHYKMGMSAEEVGERFGYSKRAALQILHDMNVPVRQKGRPKGSRNK